MSGHAYQCVLAAPPIVDAPRVSVPRVPLDTRRASPDLEDHRDEPLFVRRESISGGIQDAVCVPRAHDCACETVAHEVASHSTAQDVLRPELPGPHELEIWGDFCEGVSDCHRVTFRCDNPSEACCLRGVIAVLLFSLRTRSTREHYGSSP